MNRHLCVSCISSRKQAKSENEYIFSLALKAEGIQFLYEFAIHGGRSTLGGVSVDFIVWIPFTTAVEIKGEYWHRNTTRERWRTSIITRYFGKPPIEITEEETEDIAAARSAVKRKLK